LPVTVALAIRDPAYALPPTTSLAVPSLNEYSFNNGTAKDVVGGIAFEGSLMAGATVTGNQATFATSGPYVNLPSGLLGSFAAVTIESWVTTGVNTGNTCIFQFGATEKTSTNSLKLGSILDNFQIASFDSAGIVSYQSVGLSFSSHTNIHVVVTVSVDDNARLYINGALLGSTPTIVSSIPPSTVFYIGKSFDRNPFLLVQ